MRWHFFKGEPASEAILELSLLLRGSKLAE